MGNVAARKTLVLASSRTAPSARSEIAAGERPRLDYLALADELGGEVLDTQVCEEQPAWKRRVEHALASDLRQAQWAWKKRADYAAWLSTSERVGVPLALSAGLPSRKGHPPHVLIGHILTSARKRQLERLTRVFRLGFSQIICLSSTQEDYLLNQVRLPAARVHRLFHHVDTQFYRPDNAPDGEYILAVGRENRDYSILIAAARQTGLPVTIVASSLWAIRGGGVAEETLPPNVTVRRDFVSFTALRELYGAARMVVVPLHESEYAAGSTGLLEGMAMGKPVLVTQTRGLADYLADGRTHRAVPPGDAGAMAEEMLRLWDDAPGRTKMGRAARQLAEEKMSMEQYVRGVASVVRRAQEEME